MKKLNIVMIMLITAFVFMACEKEEAVETKNQESESEIMAPPGGGVELTILDESDPVEEWCEETGGNCLPETTIEAPELEVFENYIAKGASGVKDYFNDEDLWGDMFPVLEQTPDFLDKLQSGSYEIETHIQNDGTYIWKATHIDDEDDYFGLTGVYDEE